MDDVVGVIEHKNVSAAANYTQEQSDSDSDWYDPFDWVQQKAHIQLSKSK